MSKASVDHDFLLKMPTRSLNRDFRATVDEFSDVQSDMMNQGMDRMESALKSQKETFDQEFSALKDTFDQNHERRMSNMSLFCRNWAGELNEN